MPENPEVDMNRLETESKIKIIKFTKNEETKSEFEEIAFGLKALKIIFVMDEDKGSTDNLEKQIKEIPGVGSVEAVDVRRAIG